MADSSHDIAMRATIAALLQPLAVAAVTRLENADSEFEAQASTAEMKHIKTALEWLATATSPLGRV
jgi:hypothetical protein